MPRPKIYRHVCALPESVEFGPKGPRHGREVLNMSVDEYEAIRLIDLEGYSQIECAQQMQVARTTAQKIYVEGKKKLADALVNGKLIRIEGGEYELCQEKKIGRHCRRCRRDNGQGSQERK